MRFTALVCLALASTAASAQIVPHTNNQPAAPTEKASQIPDARDVPYPGTIQLTVDASDVTRGIFRIRERVPVTGAGDLVLLYPKWIPGGHSPRGDINKVAGFKFSANGSHSNGSATRSTSPPFT